MAAGAAVTEQQVQEATGKAVSWFRGQQEANGALGPNGGLDPAWALLGLAGAGVNAADLSTGFAQPSAQDYYLGLWTGANDKVWTSTGTPQSSDYERVILLAKAAGLDPLRLSPEQNLLAKLAGFDKGGYFGLKSTFNQTMFASIALDQLPVPNWLIEQVAQNIEVNAHEDGGYTFSTIENQAAYERPGEIDLTGAALAGLCGAGRTVQSLAVAKGIAFLEAQRSVTTGQIGNVDSTSWALDGLGACGVKRGSSGWTAGDEETIEWLLSQQLSEGAWPSNGIANFYATQDALRALDAPGFDVESPPRLNSSEPARRQPPSVTVGTPVPVVLAINAGFGSIQLCSTTAPAGATLPEVLMAARAQSSPAGCVSQLEAGAEGVTSINGAVAQAGSGGGWEVSLDNGTEQDTAGQSVGFGEVVGLRLDQPAPFTVSASSLQFDPMILGEADGTLEVIVTNRDSNTLSAQAPAITGAAHGDYTIVSQTCAGQELAFGSSCTVTVGFTPSATGVRDATLEVPVEGQGALAISLRGEGTTLPRTPQQEPIPGGFETATGPPTTGPVTTGLTTPTPTGTGQGASNGPVLLGVTGLSTSRLLLRLAAAGTITVRIAREVGVEHRRHWRTVKTLTVKVTKAGQIAVKLPHLLAGRYRVTVTSPEGKSFTRTLTISTRTARRA